MAGLVHRIDQADYAVADRADDLLLAGKTLDEGGEFGIAREIPRGGRAADEKHARIACWLDIVETPRVREICRCLFIRLEAAAGLADPAFLSAGLVGGRDPHLGRCDHPLIHRLGTHAARGRPVLPETLEPS